MPDGAHAAMSQAEADPPPTSSTAPLPHHAWVALGANLGDAMGQVGAAITALDSLAQCRLLRHSSLWRTAPIDAPGPDYVNAVALLATSLTPLTLLDALQALEQDAGRTRSTHHAPRTLDLDLLLYDTLCMRSSRLVLPHPRMHERAFVLAPLAELQASLIIPGHGRVADLLSQVTDQRITPIPLPTSSPT